MPVVEGVDLLGLGHRLQDRRGRVRRRGAWPRRAAPPRPRSADMRGGTTSRRTRLSVRHLELDDVGVVAREGRRPPPGRRATGTRRGACVPVGRRDGDARDPPPLGREVVHQVGQLDGEVPALWPPPAVEARSTRGGADMRSRSGARAGRVGTFDVGMTSASRPTLRLRTETAWWSIRSNVHRHPSLDLRQRPPARSAPRRARPGRDGGSRPRDRRRSRPRSSPAGRG